MTDTMTKASVRPQYSAPAQLALRHANPILVATDGSVVAAAAVRAASLISEKLGVDTRVVSVIEPMQYLIPTPGAFMQSPFIAPQQAEATRASVAGQLASAGMSDGDWTIDVRYGRPATEIHDAAEEMDAQLIIIGLAHRGAVDRLLEGETALDVLRDADIPVFLAAPEIRALPSRVLIAVDFSAHSIAAAREAMRLVSNDARVYLVHVKAEPTVFDGTPLWEEDYEDVARAELARLAGLLGAPPTMTVETIVVTGRPVRALVDFAVMSHVDMIAAGSHGTGMMRRIFVGSVATGILHRFQNGSVLIVPERAYRREIHNRSFGAVSGAAVSAAKWTAELKEFTNRNCARPVTLEIDDVSIGAQREAVGIPLIGVDFDVQTGSAQIMLGGLAGGDSHLTHTVGPVTSIDLLKRADGSDQALKIGHEGGQTLLILRPREPLGTAEGTRK